MKGDRFLKEREAEWKRLTAYADRLGQGSAAALSSKDILEFVRLYRRATSDLARARTLEVRSEVVEYLNRLVGRIHFQIYTTSSFSLAGIWHYFTAGFPQAVRRNGRWVVLAIALTVLPGAAAYLAVQTNPTLARVFTMPGYIDHMDEAFGSEFGEEGRSPGDAAWGTSFYITNNVQVSFMAFALGVFAGLGSAYILIKNGLILGGTVAAVRQYGLSYNFWSFVSSHGAIELTAIFLAGAAGMMVGSKLINPGPYTRLRALVVAGREAGLMLYGVIVMLCIAAVIEAGISPSTLPNPVKITFGLVNLVAVVAYFTFAGRRAGAPSQITNPKSQI